MRCIPRQLRIWSILSGTALTASYLRTRSANGEVGQIDRVDPFRLRINHQCADRERDAVGNSTVLGVELEQPVLAGERIGQRQLAELKQQQRQGAAEQRGIEQIIQQMAEAEP